MRVHELAKQLSSELGKSIASSELLVYLNKKKEGMKPQSSISDELISYIRDIYIKPAKAETPKKVEQKPTDKKQMQKQEKTVNPDFS